MNPKRLAELLKKAEEGTLSPEESKEISESFNKAKEAWPERKRQIEKLINDPII